MDTKLEVGCDFNNCTSVSSPGANIASPILMSLIGILGNAIALVTIHQMKLERQRTVFFVFVAGLAFADLVGKVLTTIPVLLVYSHGYYVGGSMMCNYHAFTMITIGVLTPMIACAMALERFFGIRHGYFYMLHFNPRRARISLLSMWLAAIFFSSLPIFGFGQYAIQYPGTWCFLNLHPENSVDAAYSVTFAILNLIFICVMIICNILVQCTLVVMRCQRKSASRADRFRRTHRNNVQQEELEVQMMFVLLAITIVFTVSWTPLQILANQFYEHRTAEEHRSDLIAVRLASVNQILDPWVYIFCRKLCFRRNCSCWTYIVKKTRTGSFQPSSSQKDLNRTSSLQSALVNVKSQCKLTRGNHCSRCHHKTNDEATGVDNVEGIPMIEDLSHSSYSNNGQRISFINESANVPFQEDDASNSVAVNTSTSEGTDNTASANNIPIPIFKSSQYSIQRQKYFQQKRRNNFSEQPLFPARDRKQLKGVSDVLRSPSISGQHPNRRRHSWCCASTETSVNGRRYALVMSKPAARSDAHAASISG